MILALRTDTFDSELYLMATDGSEISSVKWHSGRELSIHLLSKIDRLLSEHGSTLNDISGLIVFEGPGSFTGLRISVSVVNALAYGLAAPVVATEGNNWLALGLQKLKETTTYMPVQPMYGADPHITQPKK